MTCRRIVCEFIDCFLSLFSAGSPDDLLVEGVNKMGLFTEDLEKTDSNAKVPATIVEGPVSPQTPTTPSPPNDESSGAAPVAVSESNNVPKQGEEEDDDDDLFKGN